MTLIPASALSRRRFLGGLAQTAGALALAGCNKAPPEKIIPYVRRPPEVVPGVAEYYATTTTRGGYGVGLLVESHVGRPTKIEGHPEHPASLGGTLAQEQAEILTLYDPDRARNVRGPGGGASWTDFERRFGIGTVDKGRRPEVLLLGPTASPLVEHLLSRLRDKRPKLRVFFDATDAPIGRWEASERLFGDVLDASYRFDEADRVVAFDADFLSAMPMSIRWSHDFAKRRAPASPRQPMSRLYSVESLLTVTGATADHRLAVPGSDVGRIAAALLGALSVDHGIEMPETLSKRARPFYAALGKTRKHWVAELASDLARRRGHSIVMAGEHQPGSVHAVVVALNAVLGNFDQTIVHHPSPLLDAGKDGYRVDRYADALGSGDVETAYVLGVNPVYTSARELSLSERLTRIENRVVADLFEHETAETANWFLPLRHFLESWGDARAADGTVSIRQPLIRPLYQSRSVEAILATLAGVAQPPGRRLVEQSLKDLALPDGGFDALLERGLASGSAYAPRRVRIDFEIAEKALSEHSVKGERDALELDLLPDPRIGHGRLANNPLLLELPEPVTKLVWDNAALVSSKDARELGVTTGDVIQIASGHGSIEAPVLESEGQAEGAIGLWLGWGRSGAESRARGLGVSARELRTGEQPWFVPGLDVRRTGRTYPLVTTQVTRSQHGREIVLYRTRSEWKKHPEFTKDKNEPPPTVLPTPPMTAPQWGMAVDLGRCTGCSACVVACQVENNVPTVGKVMVGLGREMHWLRVDTYVEHGKEQKVLMQPMLCQHCEKAPCEYVCPVNATVHSPDGLNEMVYNRCVGTRFCSNNCPYKVRRFNYYEWQGRRAQVEHLAHNPNVTVRARGVMEKCTFCVQRIRRAGIEAKREGRPLVDGDVKTACEQACPSGAIVFGPVSDAGSRVSKLHRTERTYGALGELGTRPRVRYLARITNDNEGMNG